MDKFIRRIVDAFLQGGVEDVMAALCEGGMSAPEAEMMIKERCDSLAVVMYSEYLEEVDRQVRKDLEGRKGWVVNRRRDSRSILSIMGNVEYERTYYHNEGDRRVSALVRRYVRDNAPCTHYATFQGEPCGEFV